jgi:2-methylcitrate dehydratase PrpD
MLWVVPSPDITPRKDGSRLLRSRLWGELPSAIPHIPPFILPPLLAMAEKTRASGKALILAVVIAHEIAARLSAAAGQHAAGAGEDVAHPIWGINDESIMAAASGLASLLSLGEAAALSAIGLAWTN